MSTLKVHTIGICKSHKSIVHICRFMMSEVLMTFHNIHLLLQKHCSYMSVYDVRSTNDFSQYSPTSAVVQYDSLSRSRIALTLRIFK